MRSKLADEGDLTGVGRVSISSGQGRRQERPCGNPRVHGTVFDRPQVAGAARQAIEAKEVRKGDRCSKVSYVAPLSEDIDLK
jgi:hypothetical protein